MSNVRRLGAEVLRYTARGYSYAETGTALGISADAVKSRHTRLYELLGARNAAHAVVIAGVEGLLSRDDLKAAFADRRDP